MELAQRKFYLDSMVNQREGTIIRLEGRLAETESYYNDLLKKAGEINDERNNQNLALQSIIASQGVEIKNSRKKTRWIKIKNTVKDGLIGILSAVIIYQSVEK